MTAIELLYDLCNKDFLLVYKPSGAMSRAIAKIREEEFDAKLKSLQQIIESANYARYPKMRYIKLYTEFDISMRGFGYSFDNVYYARSLFGTFLRIIQDKLTLESN